MRRRFLVFIAAFQTLLLAAQFFIYKTWMYATDRQPGEYEWVWAVLLPAVSFVAASLLAFRSNNFVVRWLYRVSAVWLGLSSLLLFAAMLFWPVWGVARLAGWQGEARWIAGVLFGAALLLGLYAMVNAHWTRVRRITVALENLPQEWRGRTAALISDLHLGHVRNGSFLRRTVAAVMREKPDVVFIAGDLYDGTAIDAEKAAEPLRELRAPHGAYFVAGNHEQMRDDTRYLSAVSNAGVKVLQNKKVEVEGLQIVGVPYNHATHDAHFRSVLQGIEIDRNRASILLTHAPDRPGIAAEEGLSLQVSGHTHLGQYYPGTWLARRMYGRFVYGLSRIGNMQLYTSSGVGTWGPPLRWGSHSEIVLMRLEAAAKPAGQ